MRVAVLWSRLSGYLDACLKATASEPGVQLFVAHFATSANAPFDAAQFGWIPNRLAFEEEADARLIPALEAFKPDLLLVNAWSRPAYRAAASHFRRSAVRVLFMDNQWHGKPLQWLARVAGPMFLVDSLFDAVFVPGEPQAAFARRLGFRESRILRGGYTCDWMRFASVQRTRSERPEAFVAVGRLEPAKGIDVLLQAYRLYVASAVAAGQAPWPLILCGTGPMQPLVDAAARDLPTLDYRGFVQPDYLPGVLGDASAFVMASRVEPWGVAIHEAATAGLGLICTAPCGAAVHLVQDGWSGFTVEPESPEELARAMDRFAGLPLPARRAMGEAAHQLSRQFTPERWARQLLSRAEVLHAELRSGKA